MTVHSDSNRNIIRQTRTARAYGAGLLKAKPPLGITQHRPLTAVRPYAGIAATDSAWLV